ncbi:MAG: hypothetical protein WCG80_08470 [Spirochaetales bacterium]
MNTVLFDPAEFAGARTEDLLHHVEEHKYLANQAIPREITFEEALDSWNQLVYSPLSSAINESQLAKAFPEVGRGELFLWVSRHWHYMKQAGEIDVMPHEAVLDFGTRFGHDALTRFGFFLKKLSA